MENRLKKEVIRTEITGQIGGVDVTLNYERKGTAKPEAIYAFANIKDPAATDPMAQQLGTVNMNYSNGNRGVQISGSISIADVSALVAELEVEMKTIAGA